MSTLTLLTESVFVTQSRDYSGEPEFRIQGAIEPGDANWADIEVKMVALNASGAVLTSEYESIEVEKIVEGKAFFEITASLHPRIAETVQTLHIWVNGQHKQSFAEWTFTVQDIPPPPHGGQSFRTTDGLTLLRNPADRDGDINLDAFCIFTFGEAVRRRTELILIARNADGESIFVDANRADDTAYLDDAIVFEESYRLRQAWTPQVATFVVQLSAEVVVNSATLQVSIDEVIDLSPDSDSEE
ncbi:MAG: hypothetical protein AAFV53_01755 [Myxococcota bacterium]